MSSSLAATLERMPPLEPEGANDCELLSFARVARQRRSVYGYLDRAVPRTLVELAIDLAMLAPNHYRTQPWRFFVFADAGREQLARAYEAAALRLGRDPQRARTRAFEAPVMIAVACMPSLGNPKVKPTEESFAVAAAVQTMLLAFASCGIASLIATGDLPESDEVCDLVGVPRDEGRVMTVVSVGYADPARPAAKRVAADTTRHVRWCETQ